LRKTILLLNVALAASLAPAQVSPAATGNPRVIYESVDNILGSSNSELFVFSNSGWGDTVTTSGPARVSRIETLVYAEAFNGAPTISCTTRAFLWTVRNDGLAGLPLWQSAPATVTFKSGSYYPVSVVVPNVAVPASFLWSFTFQCSGFLAGELTVGPALTGTVSVGSSAPGFLVNNPLGLFFQPFGSSSVYGRVIAN
jgi:hypothetical protein